MLPTFCLPVCPFRLLNVRISLETLLSCYDRAADDDNIQSICQANRCRAKPYFTQSGTVCKSNTATDLIPGDTQITCYYLLLLLVSRQVWDVTGRETCQRLTSWEWSVLDWSLCSLSSPLSIHVVIFISSSPPRRINRRQKTLNISWKSLLMIETILKKIWDSDN